MATPEQLMNMIGLYQHIYNNINTNVVVNVININIILTDTNVINTNVNILHDYPNTRNYMTNNRITD